MIIPKPYKFILILALLMLMVGLLFGFLGSLVYIFPDLSNSTLLFPAIRPLHVSAILFWILLGASGSMQLAIQSLGSKPLHNNWARGQLICWLIAITGIFYAYATQQFGGREYWEFPPKWALFITTAWLLNGFNFFYMASQIKKWPVYIWMWMTGTVFFLLIYLENYLWLFPYFRSHFVLNMTIQWKVNGSIVGAWNQILYGTAFYLTDRISGNQKTGFNKLAFYMYFLGLFNLMFNWGHHIYTLPTADYLKYFGYLVSMTEWIFFIRIIQNWKKSLNEFQKNVQFFPYQFIIASELWAFINLFQALLMSIPAINLYTHGTHVTVAHAMGTTIGINSMILLASITTFLSINPEKWERKLFGIGFWSINISLIFFMSSLNIAGVIKGIWQVSPTKSSFTKLMLDLQPWFGLFSFSGFLLLLSFSIIIGIIIRQSLFRKQ